MVTTADAQRRRVHAHGVAARHEPRRLDALRAGRRTRTTTCVMPGFKYNMMDLQAAIGLHQLARHRRMHARRAAICARYDAGARRLCRCGVPAARCDGRRARPASLPRAPRRARRRASRATSLQRGCASAASRPAFTSARCTCTPITRSGSASRRGMFPAAEAVSDTTLSLPLSAAMADASVDRVIEACHDVLR